ncbi:MAG: 3'-5' exonuclease [Desulfovibrionaceae bacterium]|nr:3'-5' exonuclease [Desulfovibrionaceae bacterium]
MATMFPSEVDDFSTEGERLTWNFLKSAARPDQDFLCWYEPDIEDREPDFVLYSPDCGLIVMEVKDWLVSQINEADPKTVLLTIGNRTERRKNPMAQAKEYRNRLLCLLTKPPLGKPGQILCPVTMCVVFPHISRNELRENKALQQIFPDEYLLCWDEMQENSPYWRDLSGQKFQEWLKNQFPPPFPFYLAQGQLNEIRAAIFPQVRLSLPRQQQENADTREALLALDHDQENLARTIGPGRHLIVGPAGSGRTLILASLAWHLPRVSRNIRRILVVCFNLSLVGYIRRLLAQKGVSIGPEGVEVLPFYSLCERILGEKLSHSAESADFYSLVVQETLERLDGSHPLQQQWDAVLVDEGQDFSAEMAQVLCRLLPKNGTLVVAKDDNQRLYQEDGSVWEQLGIERLRVHRLSRQYRNTAAIARFAAKMLPDSAGITFAGTGGKIPDVIVRQSVQDQVQYIVQSVRHCIGKGVPMNEIAILYTKSHMADICLPEYIAQELEYSGIMARWISKNADTKHYYDITTDSVTVSTIHSVKGLDFSHVFIIGLDALPDTPHSRRLAYVGMTRARDRLTVVCGKRAGLVM